MNKVIDKLRDELKITEYKCKGCLSDYPFGTRDTLKWVIDLLEDEEKKEKKPWGSWNYPSECEPAPTDRVILGEWKEINEPHLTRYDPKASPGFPWRWMERCTGMINPPYRWKEVEDKNTLGNYISNLEADVKKIKERLDAIDKQFKLIDNVLVNFIWKEN